MSTFGMRARCPDCGRTVGVLNGPAANLMTIRYHRDGGEVRGEVCPGGGKNVHRSAASEEPVARMPTLDDDEEI